MAKKATSEIYCASWCGGGCTRKQYLTAMRKAKALARKMGKGWSWHVWENLGWHYQAVCGSASVSPRKAGYTVNVRIGNTFSCDDRDPRRALAVVLEEVDSYMKRWRRERAAIPAAAV